MSKGILAAALILLPAYGSVGVGLYWLFDIAPPLTVQRFGPVTLRPVLTYEEAKAQAITEAKADSEVFIWQEWCLSDPESGNVSMNWVGAFMATIPDRMGIGEKGCFQRSISVETPMVKFVRDFKLHKTIAYRNNPVNTVIVRFPEVPLRIVP